MTSAYLPYDYMYAELLYFNVTLSGQGPRVSQWECSGVLGQLIIVCTGF